MEVNATSNEFQREYIEYLKERNTELLDRLNQMKETYETKILSKDLNKRYLNSVLENVLNICTVFPQEIDLFFDKMTAAMSALKDVLLRKSEMEQLVDKILKAMSPSENFTECIAMNSSSLLEEQSLDERGNKKAEVVKVSPMIKGHIISTAPKIYLSRVSGIYTSCQKNEAHNLSPIIEVSPDNSSEQLNTERSIFKNLKIPLERINCDKLPYNYVNEESPRNRFKGPKTWKKSLFSNKCQSNNKRNSVFMENNENLNKKLPGEETEDINPLEGPSWLYQDNSENSSSHLFLDHKRRKHRFATMFDSNEDCINFVEEKKKSFEKNSNEYTVNYQGSDNEINDFGSIEKKTRRSSEDLSNDFIASEDDENNTPLKRNGNNKRGFAKESGSKDEITNSHKNIINRNLNSNKKKKEKSLSNEPANSNSVDEGENQENSDRNFSKVRKSYKSTLETPNKVFVMLEDCITETLRKSTNTEIPSLTKSCVKKKSKSPTKKSIIFSPCRKGRKKRNAAPSFKLTEPKLKTKLRRN